MLESILKKYFGYDSFRPGQKEVIEHLIDGEDVIALLPTGMGKSLCYQLPGFMFQKPVLIISPLLSLMQDQVDQMKRLGEKKVVALNSFLNFEQKRNAIHFLEQYRFIFISPEMLLQHQIQQKLQQMELSLICIDEAHCISQWGFDFRPDYLKIGEVFSAKKRPPILALTATATQKVIGDIQQYLMMKEPYQYLHSVDRPNIHFSRVFFQEKEEKIEWIVQHVLETEGPGIIYTQSRKRADDISERILRHGIHVASYHGGKDTEDRQFIQQQFIVGALDWVVATNAFGMGVHKGDVRQIIHESIPSNVANYLQEVGRAGRDGEDAVAILLYSDGDEEIAKFVGIDDLPTDSHVDIYHNLCLRNEGTHVMFQNGDISETAYRVLHYWMNQLPPEQVKMALHKMKSDKIQEVEEMMNYVRVEGCMREMLISYFGQQLDERPFNCCTSCGFDYKTILKPRREKELSKQEITWQKRIEQLLLF